MRALIIDPYRYKIYETDIPPTLEALQSAVHGSIEYAHQFPNHDILYVNGDGEGLFDARFSLGSKVTLPGYGIIVGSDGGENDSLPALTSVNELRKLVHFGVPVAPGPAALLFSIGKKTGLDVLDAPPDGGSSILIGAHIGPEGIMVVSQLADPTKAEINTFEAGRVQFAFGQEATSGILTSRFTRQFDRKRLHFETPFHIGLEDPGTRYLPPRSDENQGRTLPLLLQDQNAICRAFRICNLPPHVCDAVEAAVIAQVIEAVTEPGFEKRHEVSRARYYSRTGSPEGGFAEANIKT